MEQNEEKTKSYLHRIANILIINGGFLKNPGLYTGEMGLVLFFAHYADFTKNKLFTEYCFYLMEKIHDSIHQESPVNFNNGLTGIGAAIEHLVQEGYFKAETDDVLEDFDEQVFSIDKLTHLSDEERSDVVDYALWRLSGNSSRKEVIIKTILPQIERVTIESDNFPSLGDYSVVASMAKRVLCSKNRLDMLNKDNYDCLLEQLKENDFIKKSNLDLGVQNGLAGLGLTLLSEFKNHDFRWKTLFTKTLTSKNEPLSV